MSDPGGEGGDFGEGGHGDFGGHGDHGGHGEHDGHDGHGGHDGHYTAQNADGFFDDINDLDYDDNDAHHYQYDDLPGEEHSNHGVIFPDYFNSFPANHVSDAASGIGYFDDGYFHSGNRDFLDSYIYGGPLYGGFHSLQNDTYMLARMLMYSYSHGFAVYPFGYLFYPLAAELYRNSLASSSAGNSSTPIAASEQVVFDAFVSKGNDPERSYFGAHVAHGFIDVHAAFKSLATSAGLTRVPKSTGKFVQIEPIISDKGVSDWNQFVPPYSRTETPAGYYPGARGLTYFTQQCWRVIVPAPASAWAQIMQAIDCKPFSQIEVRLVTWYFSDVDDYETRIDIRVTSGRNFAENQSAAAKLCADMLEVLKAIRPTSFAEAKRCKIRAGDYLFWL